MNVISIGAFCVCAALLALSVKQLRPDIGQVISIGAAAVTLYVTLPYIKEVIDAVKSFAAYRGYGVYYIEPIIKITGIAYITELGSSLCRDCGENALAARAEMAGKVAICILTVPIAREAFVKITEIIK